jgi:hypothetical protein
MKTLLRILALLALTASAFATDITKVVAIGQTVTMTAAAEGSTPMTYQWQKDGVQVFQGQSFVIAPFAAEHAGSYTVRALNDFGAAESADRVILTLGIPPSPPKITIGLANVTVTKGTDHTLQVTATGNPEPVLQWRHGVSNIRGANESFLTISSAKPKDGGTYAVRATNAHGWAESGAVVTIANR